MSKLELGQLVYIKPIEEYGHVCGFNLENGKINVRIGPVNSEVHMRMRAVLGYTEEELVPLNVKVEWRC